MKPTLSKLKISQVDDVVEIHMKAFPGFFLSLLGRRFLKEFYKSFATDLKGIGFVAKDLDGKILGAVVGPINPQGYFKRLLINRWGRFCLASIGAVIRKPKSVLRILRAIFYRGQAPAGPTRALLSSIAVDPEAQGRGVGKALVECWVEEVQRRGLVGCYLITDADGNEAVNNFYQTLRWRVESSYVTPEGRRMHRYVFDFTKDKNQSVLVEV